jgi:two-component system OmpR family response regulator
MPATLASSDDRRATLGLVPPATPARVLVVDDEENIAYLVVSAMRLAGHDVLSAASGTAAVEAADAFAPDVVVLDVMLPDFDGFEVMRRLRAAGSRAAIVFLTARSDTADRVRGLTTGGEDYVVKPFAVEELVARVALALRRGGTTSAASGRLQVGDLVLDDEAHRVWRGDRETHLTATEFTLLRCLMASAGRVVTRAQILDHVWQYDFSGESAIVDSFVSTLRKKVDPAVDGTPRLIHTVRGVGYTIREPGVR